LAILGGEGTTPNNRTFGVGGWGARTIRGGKDDGSGVVALGNNLPLFGAAAEKEKRESSGTVQKKVKLYGARRKGPSTRLKEEVRVCCTFSTE